MKLASLINLKPLKEGAFGMSAKDLASTYSLKMLQQMRDETMMDMENDPSVEPEGGPQADYYGGTLNGLDQAIALKQPKKDVPYDVAVGKMTQDEYDEYMSTVKPDRASFEKSSKFDRMNEATEKSWSAVDVSRKAEKEISNKEWNERTSKKLDMLKKLNDAGKFKKDFDDERLQGWVDQNYSWEKLSKQFKLNESKNNKIEGNLLTERFQELAGIKPLYTEMYNELDSEPDYEWEKGSKAGPGNPEYDAAREKAKQDTRFTVGGKPVDLGSIEMGGLEMMRKYGPDDGGPDAYIEYAEFIDGTELTDIQRDEFMNKYPDITYEKAMDQLYQQEGLKEIGMFHDPLGYEPEDLDNPDEDLVIIGSGYLDIKSNFGERPSQTNGEYAELGQKVVDQLHNGDKDAALDYIFSQINEGKVCESCGQIHEGSCGYTHKTDGSKLRTPGGTKGMDAYKRTMGMMREVIKKEIKRFHENK